jgi:tetratricopeptide (TPR) repeat protein
MTRRGGPLRGVGDLVSRIARGTFAALIQSDSPAAEAMRLIALLLGIVTAARIRVPALQLIVGTLMGVLLGWAFLSTAIPEIRRFREQRRIDNEIRKATQRSGAARPVRAGGIVEQLDDDQAMALFQRTAAPKSVGEEDARELIDACGRQPEAIGVLAGRIRDHLFGVEQLLEELRVTVLSPTHHPVPAYWGPAFLARFDTAYEKLDPSAKRLYRLLALVPERRVPAHQGGPVRPGRRLTLARAPCAPAPLDREAIAKLADLPQDVAFEHVDALVKAGLVEHTGVGHYQIKREHVPLARIHLRVDEEPWRQRRALIRLARHLASEAEKWAVQPGRESSAWFARHDDLLVGMVMAARAGDANQAPLPALVRRSWFRLAVALCRWYAAANQTLDWQQVCTVVRDAPLPPRWLPRPVTNELGLVRGRPRVAGWVHNELGAIFYQSGRMDEATRELGAALEAHGTRGRAQVELNLALVRLATTGDASEVLWALRRSGRHRSPRDKLGVALTELALGAAQYGLDELDEARRHLQSAVDVFDAQGEWRGKAMALVDLALVEAKLGRRRAAIDIGRSALETYDRVDTETDPAERRRLEGLVDGLGLSH